MVRLVVDDHEVLDAHQLRHHALKHLSLGLDGLHRLAAPPFDRRTRATGHTDRLAELEGVVVGDHDLGAVQIGQQVRWDELATLVVGIGVVWLQHTQPVADRDAGCDDEEPTGEAPAARMSHGVDRLPRDQHRHDRRLTCARREIEREPSEARVRPLVRRVEVVEEPPPVAPLVRCDLGEPDDRLGSLDLAEERPDAGELMVAPVLKQPGRLGRHAPLARIRKRPPAVQPSAQFVDNRVRVVFLLRGRDTGRVAQHHRCLGGGLPALLGLWDRGDELGEPPPFEDFPRGLPSVVDASSAERGTRTAS